MEFLKVRFLAMAKLKQVWLCSSGLTKTFFIFLGMSAGFSSACSPSMGGTATVRRDRESVRNGASASAVAAAGRRERRKRIVTCNMQNV